MILDLQEKLYFMSKCFLGFSLFKKTALTQTSVDIYILQNSTPRNEHKRMEQKMDRSSHQSRSVKKVFLKISGISQENTCAGVGNFIKKRLQHRCFPVKFAKFLKTPLLKNICQRLLSN